MTPRDLIREWRQESAMYARDGHEAAAKILARVAGQLEEVAGGELVSLEEASRRTGYTTRHLARMVESGALVNVGRKGSPRFRAEDLPRKGDRAR